MSNPLVECIPNFSDARRPDVIEKIMQSISQVDGVHVLDKHSDQDHNRTVITFIGPPAAVEEAAFQSIKTAASLINLDEHVGEHPRIGATDVVPFVPITDINMVECVEIARRLGKRVGEELGIPVYLYEEAAARPERQNLENIRRGQYEALKEEMGKVAERKPDFGPEKVGTAGATVIGARQPLIAFNAYLTTGDVTIAQKIAKGLRASTGGWRYVKAMGVLVEGRAQVSMNMTNYRQSPLGRVVESIRREAERYGVGIHHTELVGLIPQEALTDAAVWHLQLDTFKPDQVLESRLYESMRELPKKEDSSSFTDALAAATPTPGGGSAAAYAATMSAALVNMICRLTIGKKKYADVETRIWKILEQSDPLQRELSGFVTRDSAAFDEVLKAARLPKTTPEEEALRTKAIEDASFLAAQVPLELCRKVIQVMKLAIEAAEIGNVNAISDAASGYAMGKAAFTAARYNVLININPYATSSRAAEFSSEMVLLESEVAAMDKVLTVVMRDRGGLG